MIIARALSLLTAGLVTVTMGCSASPKCPSRDDVSPIVAALDDPFMIDDDGDRRFEEDAKAHGVSSIERLLIPVETIVQLTLEDRGVLGRADTRAAFVRGAADQGLSSDAARELYNAHASTIERYLMRSMTTWASEDAKRALERTRACTE